MIDDLMWRGCGHPDPAAGEAARAEVTARQSSGQMISFTSRDISPENQRYEDCYRSFGQKSVIYPSSSAGSSRGIPGRW